MTVSWLAKFKWLLNLTSTVTRIIVRVAYGISATGEAGRKYIHIAEEAMDFIKKVFQPGTYLVETLPWLRFVPAWFPGATFQREFARWRLVAQAARDEPWEAALNKVSGLFG